MSHETLSHPEHEEGAVFTSTPRLRAHFAFGYFEKTAVTFDAQRLPEKVDKKTFTALSNQNTKRREEDKGKVRADLESANPGVAVTDDEVREEHFKRWANEAMAILVKDLATATRSAETLRILGNLGIHLTDNRQEDNEILRNAFIGDSHDGGSFYKRFCGRDMNDKLVEVLTVDEMHSIRDFLTHSMVGSTVAFNALVTTREGANNLTEQERERFKQEINTPFPQQDKDQLDVFHFCQEGLGLPLSQPPNPQSATTPQTDEELATTETRTQIESRVQLQPEIREGLQPLMDYINEGLRMLQDGIKKGGDEGNTELKRAIVHFSNRQSKVPQDFGIRSFPSGGRSRMLEEIRDENHLRAIILEMARNAKPGQMPMLMVAPTGGDLSFENWQEVLEITPDRPGPMTVRFEKFPPELKTKLYVEYVRLIAEEWIHEMQKLNNLQAPHGNPIYLKPDQYKYYPGDTGVDTNEADIAAYFYAQGLDLNGDFDFMFRYPSRMMWYRDMRQQDPSLPEITSDFLERTGSDQPTPEELQQTEAWLMRSPQRRRELTTGLYSRKRRELIEESAREEKRQRQALYARFPKDKYTRIPPPISDNQWERQQNKDLLTCYLASAINCLRGLGQGVYDPSQTEDLLREVMEKRLNFSPEEFVSRYRNGVDQITLGEGLRTLAGNVVNVNPSSSVVDILNAIENGATAIVPVSDNHVAAIFPGSRVFYRGNELTIQVVDSLLGIREISVEALLHSEIILEEAAAKVINEMHRFASPGMIISRKASPSTA